jgi:hypothetical protein
MGLTQHHKTCKQRLLPNTAFSDLRQHPLSGVSIAFFVSLALHILALAIVDHLNFAPLHHLPIGAPKIIARLTTSRPLINHDENRPRVISADSQAPIAAAPPSNTEPDYRATNTDSLGFRLLTQLSTTVYYRRSELTTPAKLLVEPELPQPIEQREGIANFTLLIGADGAVDTVLAGESTFTPEYMDRLKAFFATMEFEPGLIDGKPVGSRFEVEVSTSYAPAIIESMTPNQDIPQP